MEPETPSLHFHSSNPLLSEMFVGLLQMVFAKLLFVNWVFQYLQHVRAERARDNCLHGGYESLPQGVARPQPLPQKGRSLGAPVKMGNAGIGFLTHNKINQTGFHMGITMATI